MTLKTFPAYRTAARAEKPIARLALTYGLGLLNYSLTREEVETLAGAYAEGRDDAATCYSDIEADELLAYTAAQQAAALYCDTLGFYADLGLSRVAHALVCYRWAEGWVDGIKSIHARALAASTP